MSQLPAAKQAAARRQTAATPPPPAVKPRRVRRKLGVVPNHPAVGS